MRKQEKKSISASENEDSLVRDMPPSSRTEMDQALNILSKHKDNWAKMEIEGRIALLDQIVRDLPAVEKDWIESSLAAKEGKLDTFAEAVECYSVTIVYRLIHLLKNALSDISRHGKPRIPGKVSKRPDGQVVAQVVPHDWKEALALPGIRAEVWMDPSVTLDNGGIPQASFYHSKDRKGQICILLGAGNVAGLIPGDFLHKLFVEGQVVALKMNPVNAYLGPVLERGFASLINAGFLQILYGGKEEGQYLCNHALADTVHMTGSDRSFEAIVFGGGEEGQKRKQKREPVFTKPFSAELGNISPVIIVPGPWTEKEIQNQAIRMGSWVYPNSAYNCLAPRMFIQMKGWEHRKPLNKGIADFLDKVGTTKAYYPGSVELHDQFVAAHPEALQIGQPEAGHLPWTFIPDLDPTQEDDICFRREPFLSLFSETALEADSVADYIEKAVAFANDKLWGTLNASIVVHPKSMKDPAVAAAVNKAIADLRYGSIVINNWGAMAHYMMLTPWGGYPGTDIYDVQSGIGFVNNPLMFDRVQKSVVHFDFTPMADPLLAHATNNYLWSRQDIRFHRDRSVTNLLKLVYRALTVKTA